MLTLSKPLVFAAMAALTLPMTAQAGNDISSSANWNRGYSQHEDHGDENYPREIVAVTHTDV